MVRVGRITGKEVVGVRLKKVGKQERRREIRGTREVASPVQAL
jgi:hypothetical protein